MDPLDDIDREILRLLLDDARRPYSDIAERVDLSGPAVSDRVDRLRDRGLIRGFTVDVDRSLLRGGVPVLLELAVEPGHAAAVREAVAAADAVEHVFETADGSVLANATLPEGDVDAVLAEVDLDAVREYEVRLLAEEQWTPGLEAVDLTTDCAECGNTVDEEGERATLDGETYHFCCPSCRSNFVERYEDLREGV